MTLDFKSNRRDVEFIEDKFKSDSDFSAPTISLEIDSNVGSSRENESVVPNNTTEPRRSQRARKEKILDPDFIDSQAIAFLVEGDRENILKEIPMLLNMEDDPKTYSEAMASRDVAFWKEAINDEMDSILCNNTWALVELPQGSKPIGSKWVFRRKYNTDGSIQTFKARLVAKVFRQKEGIDYFDTYAPVARITSIRVLFALASLYKWARERVVRCSSLGCAREARVAGGISHGLRVGARGGVAWLGFSA
ncbi:hypothetical protein RJ639_028432 [Escallonia herrerae]|uniref:Reverse transcriptase Ty1/copia-type domain-containing protein n=1 Tax=Escallonia herrerae TaxID=1293975 RepID=A0AA88X5B1_9ASTE|nr:hypothetical protein RJ639_028432 [Escallonia herrerae]